MTPAATYFFQRKYDLVSAELPSNLHQVKFTELVRILACSKAETLEIQEPLWVRLLAKHVCMVLVWKLSRPFARRDVVSYAMENNDLHSLMFGVRRGSPLTVVLFRWILGAYVSLAYTRIAFASEGSRIVYHSLPFVSRVPSRVIDNLPQLVDTDDAHTARRTCLQVVVVARIERRKGIYELMAAWPEVEAAVANVSLLIVGDGPDRAPVVEWCAESPTSREYLGHLDHEEAQDVVASARCLVLPSVRSGRWREQIGLPIHEGLLKGLTVVTTDETGLATWLIEHGHIVVSGSDARKHLGPALIRALLHPLDPAVVRASLPLTEGRVIANHWINERKAGRQKIE
ncbi:glycosyltransferase involved in cell wall biosynthesis [Cryobacterium sp. MP_M5]|uniref:glycosyltransferase family 4 protein n=1 Tax=unclassified Cryobacterium TaxID=2649013 RepID=UPI0018C94978|nr:MULTISPECIES: glycosyltransferase family 4 protein [unclassified Cryobacterium]MBG6060163.1 glycosyltransferase involved in cell wall biosynthesis [Cryobacterium sp. MP_M3]MEC5178599.1 glycosyltransferase involved in cell wall biosynthesis [Cryobacterium sp. MP_M5]